ncbi:MAG: hypothetical protein ACFFCS_28665 [Candidatus Hodarchaeota archaeon]
MDVPTWDDISTITRDLRHVLDAIGRAEADSIPGIRARLARAIAQIRDDKISLEFMNHLGKSSMLPDQFALDFPVPFIFA